jgi:predicted thioredoxin/glutaredoxin
MVISLKNNSKLIKMKLKFFTLAFLSLTIFSCQTVKTGTAKSIDISGVGVIHKPVIADLDVKETKIIKTITLKSMESLENAKNEIIRELLNENNADLLVEPKFESKTKNGKTDLTVTGWLAYYKNFRTIEEKDIKLLEVRPAIINRVETNQSTILEKLKK